MGDIILCFRNLASSPSGFLSMFAVMDAGRQIAVVDHRFSQLCSRCYKAKCCMQLNTQLPATYPAAFNGTANKDKNGKTSVFLEEVLNIWRVSWVACWQICRFTPRAGKKNELMDRVKFIRGIMLKMLIHLYSATKVDAENPVDAKSKLKFPHCCR